MDDRMSPQCACPCSSLCSVFFPVKFLTYLTFCFKISMTSSSMHPN